MPHLEHMEKKMGAQQQLGKEPSFCKNLLHPRWEEGQDELMHLCFLLLNRFCSSGLSHITEQYQLWSPVRPADALIFCFGDKQHKRFEEIILGELKEVCHKSQHLKLQIGLDQLCVLDPRCQGIQVFLYKFSWYVYNGQSSLKRRAQRKVFFLPKCNTF